MPAHLKEAPIILSLLADKDRLHRRLHIVVDAALARAFEEGEATVASERMTLRTTFRDTCRSRQISLIGFFWTK